MGFALAAAAACSESVSSRIAAPDGPASASKNPYTGPGAGRNKVTICHAAGRAGTTHYVEITVGAPAQYGHIDEHGTPQAGHEEDYYLTPGSSCGAPEGGGGPTLTKTLVDVMKSGDTPGSMIHDDAWVPGEPVVIPVDETRWLDYEVAYTLPGGKTGTISENAQTVCGSLGTFILQCSFNESPVTYPIYSWPDLSGSGSVIVHIDLGGGGGGSCGDHTFTNTAVLTPSSGRPVTATNTITVRVVNGKTRVCGS
jgi:hypothetical protein